MQQNVYLHLAKHTICGCIFRRGLIRCFRISSTCRQFRQTLSGHRHCAFHCRPNPSLATTLDARMQELGYHRSNSWFRFASGGLVCARACVCVRQRLLWVQCIHFFSS